MFYSAANKHPTIIFTSRKFVLVLVSVIFDEKIIAVSGSDELEVGLREMQAGRQCVRL